MSSFESESDPQGVALGGRGKSVRGSRDVSLFSRVKMVERVEKGVGRTGEDESS